MNVTTALPVEPLPETPCVYGVAVDVPVADKVKINGWILGTFCSKNAYVTPRVSTILPPDTLRSGMGVFELLYTGSDAEPRSANAAPNPCPSHAFSLVLALTTTVKV